MVLTSCGRQDLLEKTLDSFLMYNTYPIREFIVIEDGDGIRNEQLARKYRAYPFVWLATGERVGQIYTIDMAYSMIKTKLIFHCEDDWEFFAPGFIEKSMSILISHDDILQVNLRAPDDLNGHPVLEEVFLEKGAAYRLISQHYDAGEWGVWHGFAWNPGLRRRREYKLIGSFGSLDPSGSKLPWQVERDASEFYQQHRFFAAILADNDGRGYVRHLGDDRHVPEVRAGGSAAKEFGGNTRDGGRAT
jgi:hypothetical protein